MLLRPSVNDSNNNLKEEINNIDNKASNNTNMLRATINNTSTDTGIRPVLSFTNLFNRGGHSNQKVQPNNNNNINNKRSNSTPVLNNSASTNSMKQQWPCDLSLSNTSIYHNSMQNYNNYDSEETESNTSQSMGVQSSTSVASTSDIDKSDTTERASNANNAMDVFLSKAGINKQQQTKLQSMRLQQTQQGLLQQNNNMGNGVQHVQLNDMKSKTQLNNNNANSILSRMVMVGGSGSVDTNNNNNNGMPIRIASITDFRQSQGNSGMRSSNSSMGNLRQSNRSSISSRGSKSRGSISRLNSRSSLGSVPENNVSTQNLCNSQWSLDRPDNTTSSNQQNQGSNGNEVFKNLTRRRSSNISSASQPNLRQARSGVDSGGGKNEQWSDPQTMVKAAGQRGEDIFAKLQELRLQKQIVMEKKEAVLKNSQRWSQPEMLRQMGSSMRGLTDSIKGVGGSANDKNEEWPTSSEEAGDTKSTAQSVFQRDDKIDEIITLKLKIANQQATIDTLSSKLKTKSQDVKKPEVSQGTVKELEAENQSLTKQLQECQMREYKLVKELKAQQDDHEREMKQMEEKNLMLRKALEEALNSQQKSSISSGGSSRSRGSRRKTSSTRSTSDDESEDEDLAFKTDQLDDSTKNKSYAWY